MLGMGACRGDEARIREGQQLFEQNRFRDAEETLAPLFQAEPRRADSIRLLFGNVLLARGELHLARTSYEVLLDRSDQYRCAALHGLARSHFYLGHPDTARSRSRELLRCARARADTLFMARARHVLGRVSFYGAAYDEAFTHQRASLRWARRVGNAYAQADALRQLGVLHWYRGRSDSALTAFYEPALRLYRNAGDSAGVATTLSNIGLIHRQRGDVRQNARYQLRAFAMRKRMGDQIGLADSYAFLAAIPGHFGHDNPAYNTTYLRKSLDLSRRIGYAWGEQVAFDALREEFREGRGYWNLFPESVDDSTFQRSGESRFLGVVEATVAARMREEWARADRLLAKAYRWADSLGYLDFERDLLVRRGQVLIERGRWDEATAVLRKAEALMPEDALLWKRLDLARARAKIALQKDASDRAVELLHPLAAEYDRRYLRALRETAPEVAFDAAAGTAYGRRARVYGSLLHAQVQQEKADAFATMERERALPFWGGSGSSGRERETFSRFVRQLERLEARSGRRDEVPRIMTTLGELYREKVAEQRTLRRTGASKADLDVTSPQALRRALRPDEVFVEYVVTEKRLLAFVARRDSARFLSNPVSEKDLSTAIRVHRLALRRGSDHPDERLWQDAGRRLYEQLVEPLLNQGWLEPDDHLLVAPHRRLWTVPVHAFPLPRGEDEPRFLIERNVVSYVPSATDLVEQRRRSPQPMRSVLAAAPETDALPHTKLEVEVLRRASFDRTQILLDAKAQRRAVRRAWSEVDLLHLAAHAQTNEQFPLYSSLQLRNGRIELHEILQDSLQARLVVLSACETGQAASSTGDAPTGASLVSFPRAFLTAGASGVIGSLWRVEDEATARLMQYFYDHATPGSSSPLRSASLSSQAGPAPSLAEALTRAQRTYLERSRRSEAPIHPFYWAGFFLIGDGR